MALTLGLQNELMNCPKMSPIISSNIYTSISRTITISKSVIDGLSTVKANKISLITDVAIWDNRSAFHNITLDYKLAEARKGDRVVSLGEKPYLDPNSTSRREALGLLESYFN